MHENSVARELIAAMVRGAPNDQLAMRYQKGLVEFDQALAAVREHFVSTCSGGSTHARAGRGTAAGTGGCPCENPSAAPRGSLMAGMDEEQRQFIGYWTGQAIAELDAGRYDEADAAARLMFNLWIQENDFKHLKKHFGINQLTSYRSTPYEQLQFIGLPQLRRPSHLRHNFATCRRSSESML